MANQLTEALTAANIGPLVQKTIDPLMLEYQRRYSPLLRAMPSKKVSSTTYYFNRRTLRAPGGFVTDGGARPVGNSVYDQMQFVIKLLQSVGGVTGYAQEVSRDQVGDLRAMEIASCVQGLMWDIEQAMLWGAATPTANGPWPQFDGLDVMINQFVGVGNAPQNAIDFAGAAISFSALDQIIDLVETNAGMPVYNDQWMFVLSPTAASKIAQLETPFQRFMGNNEIAAGLNVATYRDIPLIKSSFLASRLNGAMGIVTAGTSATGGSLPAGTYYYVIEPTIARAGIMPASSVVNQVTTGATSTVTLSFSVPVGQDSGGPQTYRVYRGTSAGAQTLLGIVDAVVTTTGDGITPIYATSIIDSGTALNVANAATLANVANGNYIGGGPQTPRVSRGEDIYLLPRDPDILLRPYVRDIKPIDIYPTTASPDQLPFALVSDTCLALRAPKFVSRGRNLLASL